MKRYLLKEYGSWGVLFLSYIAGILSAKDFNIKTIVTFVAVSIFVNSKEALTKWLRKINPKKSFIVFIVQILIASSLLIGVFEKDILKLLPYALIPLCYITLFLYIGEHALLSEICGFLLLTLSTPIAKLAITGNIDTTLYAAVALFFTAGVFKVRVQFKRSLWHRIASIIYIFITVFSYILLNMPVVPLLPLIDNLVFSLTMYKVKLQTTGWLEVLKGVIFIILLTISI